MRKHPSTQETEPCAYHDEHQGGHDRIASPHCHRESPDRSREQASQCAKSNLQQKLSQEFKQGPENRLKQFFHTPGDYGIRPSGVPARARWLGVGLGEDRVHS